MRILFDNGTPRGVAVALAAHVVEEARLRGWDTLRNGELLDAAEAAGFDVFVTTDRNIRYQQNLTNRKIAIVVLGKGRWRLSTNLIHHETSIKIDLFIAGGSGVSFGLRASAGSQRTSRTRDA